MILSDREILAAVDRGEIVIDPFDAEQLGGNSYDVRLAPVLRVHAVESTAEAVDELRGRIGDEIGRELRAFTYHELVRPPSSPHERVRSDVDMAVEPPTIDVRIPETGILLIPGILYLGSTVEYTETHRHVPYLDGRSSVGRLGVSIHVTAGRGDVGFCNHWTMELWVVQPVRVYPRVKIGQLTYHTVAGEVARVYAGKSGTTYGALKRDPMPQPSRLWTSLAAAKKIGDR